MIQNLWSVIAILTLSILTPFLLIGLCVVLVRRLSSGHYWIAVWIPMGWLVSLALVELIVSRVAGYLQPRFTGGHEYQMLWLFNFGMLLVGFAPRLRPRSRSDGLKLLIFSLCWIGVMSFINMFWIAFMFFSYIFNPH